LPSISNSQPGLDFGEVVMFNDDRDSTIESNERKYNDFPILACSHQRIGTGLPETLKQVEGTRVYNLHA
jgi:hypothetical protein